MRSFMGKGLPICFRSLIFFGFASVIWLSGGLSTKAANRLCGGRISNVAENRSLLEWNAQRNLRNDRALFDNIDALSFTYSDAKDVFRYRKLSQTFFARLSTGEREAVERYTILSGSHYERINKILEDYGFNDQIGQHRSIPARYRSEVSNLVSAFQKGVVLPRGLILFRGIASSEVRFGSAGEVVSWPRASSTSMDPETARYHLHETLGGARMYLMIIEIASPVRALLSKDPSEMEFILSPFTKFKVISKKRTKPEGQDHHVTIVHVQTQ